MVSKDDFPKMINKIREMLSNEENLKCTCPKTKCEWHGDCVKCVAIHRYYKDHIPNCFQQFVNEKIKAIAALGELEVKEKTKTPKEYWEYLRKLEKKNP